jgi:hypothetical protein
MKRINLSLSKIVDNVLNEDIVKRKKVYSSTIEDKINRAIDNKLLVSFNYDDEKGDRYIKRNPDGTPKWGNPRGIRRVLPFAFYVSKKSGEATVRGFHWSERHTKRGPHLWKEFTVRKIKNFRVSRTHFTDDDIPDDANWEGDKHATELYNIVKPEGSKNKKVSSHEYEEFISPLQRERERAERQKKGFSYDDLYTNLGKNQQGPIQPNMPDIKKGRNLKTMQNLGKPGEIDYKKAYDAFKQSDAKKTFSDWEKAEAERNQNTPGPIKQSQKTDVNNDENDEENWEEWLKKPNNNNF